MRRVLRRMAIGLACLATVGALAAQPADASPNRILSGWIPYWLSGSTSASGIASAIANASLFTDVSPFWFTAVPGGANGTQVIINKAFANGVAAAAADTQALHAAGIPVLPTVTDGMGRGGMAAILADPAKRAAHVADLVHIVMAGGYDGIDLDYEQFAFSDGQSSWASTQPNWTAFITDLAAALHGQGKQLSVTIPPPCDTATACGAPHGYWVYNLAGIAPAADKIRIMAYDYHVSSPGPIAPLPWVTGNVAYAVAHAPAAKIQIGVPNYGRSWTEKSSSGAYQLSGNCPTAGQSPSAWSSLTSKSTITDSQINAVLAAQGVDPSAIQWDPVNAENFVEYNKPVQWKDSTGAMQTCNAKRIMWFVGPQAVLARTQLVGAYKISAAASWTVGGEDPAQWPLLVAYDASLSPAVTAVAIAGPTNASFGTSVTYSAQATYNGVPVSGVGAQLQFKPQGTTTFSPVVTTPTAADGTVSFTVPANAPGAYQVYVPGDTTRAAQTSSAVPLLVTSVVNIGTTPARAKRHGHVGVAVQALPALPGQPIVAQVQVGAGWVSVGHGVADSDGRTVIMLKLRHRGSFTYRVVAVAQGGFQTGASSEFGITVR